MNIEKFQSRNYCFTAFTEPKIQLENVKYYIYQEEKCETTHRIHFQGYIELKNKMSLKALKEKVFNDNTIHLEIRKGSQEQAIDYCRKLKTRVGEPNEYGTKARQGSRTDLDEMAEVAPFTPIRTMIQIYGGNALRHINHIRTYQKIYHHPDDIEQLLLDTEFRNNNGHEAFQEMFMKRLKDKLNL